jgi:hypothetical protein
MAADKTVKGLHHRSELFFRPSGNAGCEDTGKASDMQIVGDDLHPIGQVKDFLLTLPKSKLPVRIPSSQETGARSGLVGEGSQRCRSES